MTNTHSGEFAQAAEDARLDAEFDLMLRTRSAEPEVRALMPVLRDLFDGDGYDETEDGFRWLVVDASRIVDFTAEGKSVSDALADSGRWDPETDPVPSWLLGPIEAALSGSSSSTGGEA